MLYSLHKITQGFEMKKETAELLIALNNAGKITYTGTDAGLAIDNTLSLEEMSQLVELEYGRTEQDVEQLFEVLMRKAVKAAAEYAVRKNGGF